MGATKEGLIKALLERVSIHAPVMGATFNRNYPE
tara:strand:+ start:17605 stop:17706 length:102 start_codon:yes stop_codon:yes gene_type:complete